MIAKMILPIFLIYSFLTNAQAPKPKKLEQLVNTRDSAWPLVQGWIKEAKNKVEILPNDKTKAEKQIVESQISTKFPLGAVIYETGGILVDNGWVRILGSGSSKMTRAIMDWNKGKSFKKAGEQPSFLLIADDPVGGFYALNYGALGKEDYGKVFYFAPNTLKWESLGMGYSDFLNFCFSADLEGFYEGLRWIGWLKDAQKLSPDKGYNFIPNLWTKEGGDINKVSKKEAPLEEVWSLYF